MRIRKIPGFRSGSPVRMGLATLGYLFLLLVVTGMVINAFSDDADDPDVVAAVAPTATLAPEPTATVEPEPSGPAISQAAIDEATAFMTEHTGVQDAIVAVYGDNVTLELNVDSDTSTDVARDHMDSFVRYFAAQVALEHDDLSGPSADSLGGIWQHYRLTASVWTIDGTSIMTGVLERGGGSIAWN